MTITEAKKIIDMCIDAVKKTDGDDVKIYVNKEYVLSILDMVEEPAPITWPEPDYPYPWYPTNPGIIYKDSNHWVWKKVSTGTGDDAPGKWVPAIEPGPDPYSPYCDNSSGSKPSDPPVFVTAETPSEAATVDNSTYKKEGVITTARNSESLHQFAETFVSDELAKKAKIKV